MNLYFNSGFKVTYVNQHKFWHHQKQVWIEWVPKNDVQRTFRSDSTQDSQIFVSCNKSWRWSLLIDPTRSTWVADFWTWYFFCSTYGLQRNFSTTANFGRVLKLQSAVWCVSSQIRNIKFSRNEKDYYRIIITHYFSRRWFASRHKLNSYDSVALQHDGVFARVS